MEARVVTKHPTCLLNSDCQNYHSDSSCVHPFSSDNITRLIRIVHTNGPPILFVGSIHEIYRTSKQNENNDYSIINSLGLEAIKISCLVIFSETLF